jgi:hypothetical protein
MYSFATPPIKLKLGQQIGGRGTNHYHGPITNTEQQLDHISYTLLATAMCAIMLSQNNFLEPNWRMVYLLHLLLLRSIT